MLKMMSKAPNVVVLFGKSPTQAAVVMLEVLDLPLNMGERGQD
jgi:hypothetical protein